MRIMPSSRKTYTTCLSNEPDSYHTKKQVIYVHINNSLSCPPNCIAFILDSLTIYKSNSHFSNALALLEVVTRDQPNAAVAAVHLSLPPAVVLVSQDCKDVALGKAKLLGDRCLVNIQGACYSSEY